MVIVKESKEFLHIRNALNEIFRNLGHSCISYFVFILQ